MHTTWVSTLLIAALFAGLLGVILGGWQYRNLQQRAKMRRHLDATLQRRQFEVVKRSVRVAIKPKEWIRQKMRKLAAWLETPAGQQVIAKEDRDLLAQCGFYSRKGSLYLLEARIFCMLLFPFLLWLWSPSLYLRSPLIGLFAAVALGYLSPKWMLRHWAAKRRKKAEDELPLLVDLFGLLQGSGQGVDQSLQLISQDFQRVQPGFRGLILIGILASVMSTIAAFLNSISTLFTLDVYKK